MALVLGSQKNRCTAFLWRHRHHHLVLFSGGECGHTHPSQTFSDKYRQGECATYSKDGVITTILFSIRIQFQIFMVFRQFQNNVGGWNELREGNSTTMQERHLT